MTEVALTAGSTLVAFGPFLSLFFLIVYQKSQLVIVVTSAAFFFLLAAVAASLCWRILDLTDMGGPFAAIIPAVFFQFIFRCAFVALYHRVEGFIEASIAKQQEQQQQDDGDNNNNTAAQRSKENNLEEVALLRLELNDAACGVAAGVGYGGMHLILLYGTLLASEVSNNVGVLYQDYCPSVPSLAVSAVYALCFFVMDMFWMLNTFFGMRRRLICHRGDMLDTASPRVGGWFGNSRSGGNKALLWNLFSHFLASLMTTADFFKNGCVVTVPAVLVVTLAVCYMFWSGVGRIYMPPGRNRRVGGGESFHDE